MKEYKLQLGLDDLYLHSAVLLKNGQFIHGYKHFTRDQVFEFILADHGLTEDQMDVEIVVMHSTGNPHIRQYRLTIQKDFDTWTGKLYRHSGPLVDTFRGYEDDQQLVESMLWAHQLTPDQVTMDLFEEGGVTE